MLAPTEQLTILNSPAGCAPAASFEDRLASSGQPELRAEGLDVMQINVGKLCNQTCRHCHVDAGPHRTESMSRETAELCIEKLAATDIPTLDITGGAPELNPNFRYLVESARSLGRHVMDRCNLTVLLLASQRDLAEFLACHQVEIVASLPYFTAERTDSQRGGHVFDKSIEALGLLNRLGYGQPGSPLKLNLAYNPTGAFLPGAELELEADFRRELRARHGVEFHRLYAMANMPISRFLEFLIESGNYARYMNKLTAAYNPQAARGVMCRTMVSVGWDGTLYDCDFNQMIDLRIGHGAPAHIRDFKVEALAHRRIVTGRHCYGCTAGSGSSCGGATA